MKNLFIFDWDDTLMPALISNIIINEMSINTNNITYITVIMYNLLIILYKLNHNNNNKLIILTAARSPWVNKSILKAEQLIYNNVDLIELNL